MQSIKDVYNNISIEAAGYYQADDDEIPPYEYIGEFKQVIEAMSKSNDIITQIKVAEIIKNIFDTSLDDKNTSIDDYLAVSELILKRFNHANKYIIEE